MVNVKILCGGFGLRLGNTTKLILRNQTVAVPEDEAKRLISQGLAISVENPPLVEPDSDNTQHEIANSDDCDTPNPDEVQETEVEDPAADEGYVESEEDEVDLTKLSLAELKELCTEAGINIKGLNSRAKLIATYEAQSLPDLTAEDPV